MKLFSRQTTLSSLSDLSVNLSSGWLGILLISPGFLGVSFNKFLELLSFNLPPAILSLVIGMFLKEKSKI